MQSDPDALVCLMTCPDAETAERIGRTLVEEELAACVNIAPEVRSIYRWQGRVSLDVEALCLIKTTRAGFEALRARVVALHPYEVPELIALPIVEGSAPYLDWLRGSIKAGKAGRAG